MVWVLRTDWGDITMPEDMVGLCRLRKDGVPDRRFRGAARWWARYGEEVERLKRLELQGTNEKGA